MVPDHKEKGSSSPNSSYINAKGNIGDLPAWQVAPGCMKKGLGEELLCGCGAGRSGEGCII